MQRKNIETKLGKVNFAYQEGDPLVVYLNGFGSFDTAQSFSKIMDSLPKSFGIFAPDYLNSGFSGVSTTEYTVKDEAKELSKIINNFQAKQVVIVAHSIGGVYAMQMKDLVNNLIAFVGIEPTTREIVLNPLEDPSYIEKSQEDLEEKIRNSLSRILTSEEYNNFWKTTNKNAKKFDKRANQNAQAAYENDEYWKDNSKLNEIPSVIITEKYRENEYKRSEYVTSNLKSKVIIMGDSHYIHFEVPREIAKAIKKYLMLNKICKVF